MKKEVIIIFLMVFLVSFAFAANEDSNSGNNANQIVGASCGTVSPDSRNECCMNKGYGNWDSENQKCEGQNKENQNNIEETNKYQRSNLTKTQIQNIIQARNRIEAHYQNQSECPRNCSCSGSTIKCELENKTRTMTVHAGNSGNIIVQIKNTNMSTNVTLYKTEDGKVYAVFKNNETRKIILPDEIRERMQNHTRTRLHNESINLTEEGKYRIEARKEARLFFLFKVRERINAEIDAETGEIIKTRTRWWGFLARDVKDSEGQ